MGIYPNESFIICWEPTLFFLSGYLSQYFHWIIPIFFPVIGDATFMIIPCQFGGRKKQPLSAFIFMYLTLCLWIVSHISLVFLLVWISICSPHTLLCSRLYSSVFVYLECCLMANTVSEAAVFKMLHIFMSSTNLLSSALRYLKMKQMKHKEIQ